MSETRRDLFARPLPPGYREELRDQLAEKPEEQKKSAGSLLTFRIGDAHFGLPADAASAIAPTLHIARIPHRSGTVLLGLVAFRGDLLPCVSLENLLGLESTSSSAGRTLILEESAGRRWAVPIDSVTGVGHDLVDTVDLKNATLPISANWISAAYSTDESTVFILDAPTLFRQINLATA